MAYNNYTDKEIQAVWRKGKKPSFFWSFFYSANQWRTDICGSWICRSDYGRRDSEYGWEIDHIRPKSKDGSNLMRNLQPLHWRNNLRKGDKYPWSCGE